MAQVQLWQDRQVAFPVRPELPDVWRPVLNGLRVTALQCRVSARTDLFKACALLSTQPDTAQDAYARALMRCLRQAIRTTPVFYRPGTTEMSFDEAWLMRAVMVCAAADMDSFAFLIQSRVAPPYRRQIAFLINGVSRQLDNLE